MSDVDYAEMGKDLGALVQKKQAAYGDSVGKSGLVLRILYPNGINHEQLDDALMVTRCIDKLFRIATDRDALGESPWRDIAGYAMLAAARVEGKAKGSSDHLADIVRPIAAASVDDVLLGPPCQAAAGPMTPLQQLTQWCKIHLYDFDTALREIAVGPTFITYEHVENFIRQHHSPPEQALHLTPPTGPVLECGAKLGHRVCTREKGHAGHRDLPFAPVVHKADDGLSWVPGTK